MSNNSNKVFLGGTWQSCLPPGTCHCGCVLMQWQVEAEEAKQGERIQAQGAREREGKCDWVHLWFSFCFVTRTALGKSHSCTPTKYTHTHNLKPAMTAVKATPCGHMSSCPDSDTEKQSSLSYSLLNCCSFYNNLWLLRDFSKQKNKLLFGNGSTVLHKIVLLWLLLSICDFLFRCGMPNKKQVLLPKLLWCRLHIFFLSP